MADPEIHKVLGQCLAIDLIRELRVAGRLGRRCIREQLAAHILIFQLHAEILLDEFAGLGLHLGRRFRALGPVDGGRVPIVVHLVQLSVVRALRAGDVPSTVLDQRILDVQYLVRHITTNAVP